MLIRAKHKVRMGSLEMSTSFVFFRFLLIKQSKQIKKRLLIELEEKSGDNQSYYKVIQTSKIQNFGGATEKPVRFLVLLLVLIVLLERTISMTAKLLF